MPLSDILRWLPIDISEKELRNYIYNKALYPKSLPMGAEELAIEQALACQAMLLAVRQARKAYSPDVLGYLPGLLPWFEPIIASGSVLTKAPSHDQALMMVLNGLQPTGVTTIAVDRNNLAASLGATASVAPLLTVQSLERPTSSTCARSSAVGKHLLAHLSCMSAWRTMMVRVRAGVKHGSCMPFDYPLKGWNAASDPAAPL
jgi:hypothetical protein